MLLPDLLKRARKTKGLTQYQVADLMKINQSNYSKLERGLIDMTHTMILRFCNAIGTTIQEFYEIDPEIVDRNEIEKYQVKLGQLSEEIQKEVFEFIDSKLSK